MSSVQRYARAAGIMFLISFAAGSFGEFYVPSKLIVAGNAAATVSNIVDHEMLFRLGFAGYLLEALCDVGLALVLYVLLKPVHRNLALLSAFLGLISTALFAVCEMFFFSAPLLLKNPVFAQSFSKEQLDALIYFFVRVYAVGAGLFMVFYGSFMKNACGRSYLCVPKLDCLGAHPLHPQARMAYSNKPSSGFRSNCTGR